MTACRRGAGARRHRIRAATRRTSRADRETSAPSSALHFFPTALAERKHPCPTVARLQRLELLADLTDRLLRVAEQHRRALVVEQRVVDPGEAGVHRPLQHDHRSRLVDVEDRHAVDRRVRLVTRRRVGDVVGTDGDRDAGAAEFVVDVVHFLHRVVLDVGLGQQHVHVSGHPAGHRVDRVLHRHALVLEERGHVLEGVLSLRDRQPFPRTPSPWLPEAIRSGASAADVGFTVRSPSPPPDTATPPPPNPPATIAGIERFIALAIKFVRIEQDAPRIMPATIIAVLLSAKPAAAADNPVIALRSEITTGMSAPPIGSTTISPSTPAAASRPIIHHSGAPPPGCAAMPITTAEAIAASSSTMFSGCCAFPIPIGRPGRISCSLPNAMSDPQNEIEPMIAANSDATTMCAVGDSP